MSSSSETSGIDAVLLCSVLTLAVCAIIFLFWKGTSEQKGEQTECGSAEISNQRADDTALTPVWQELVLNC